MSERDELLRLRNDMNRLTQVLASNPNFDFDMEPQVPIPPDFEGKTLGEFSIRELTELGKEMRRAGGGEAAACVVASW